jgi:hypothetical protein
MYLIGSDYAIRYQGVALGNETYVIRYCPPTQNNGNQLSNIVLLDHAELALMMHINKHNTHCALFVRHAMRAYNATPDCFVDVYLGMR